MCSNLINKISIVVFLLFTFTAVKAQNDTLSKEARISILTCSPGDELYSLFGHTGIRIQDSMQDLDVVFNYGMFSFGGSSMKDQIDFGLKFVRGNLRYWLGSSSFKGFMYSYVHNERWVYEQVLNLSQDEKEELFRALIENYKPENRAYRYDFFFDNCSSRVRDILVTAMGPVFGDENSRIQQKTDKSFIDLIDPYISHSPWLDFGMDIMLGLPSSRKATPYEFMFLPDHLMEEISKVDGLVSHSNYIIDFEHRHIPKENTHWLTPFIAFTILFVLLSIISYTNFKRNKHWFFIDRLLLFLTSLIGCLYLFMWFGTKHVPAHANLNLFWAFPFNIVALFFVKNPKWRMYFKVISGLAGFILLAWFISPQQYHIAIIPLTLSILVRYTKTIHYYTLPVKHENAG